MGTICGARVVAFEFAIGVAIVVTLLVVDWGLFVMDGLVVVGGLCVVEDGFIVEAKIPNCFASLAYCLAFALAFTLYRVGRPSTLTLAILVWD